MTQGQELIVRILLFLVAALLGALAAIEYLHSGFGITAAVLAGISTLALWGTLSPSPRVREAIASIFLFSI